MQQRVELWCQRTPFPGISLCSDSKSARESTFKTSLLRQLGAALKFISKYGWLTSVRSAAEGAPAAGPTSQPAVSVRAGGGTAGIFAIDATLLAPSPTSFPEGTLALPRPVWGCREHPVSGGLPFGEKALRTTGARQVVLPASVLRLQPPHSCTRPRTLPRLRMPGTCQSV